jgi:hypothetical protein
MAGGRPTKLTPKFMATANAVLFEDINAVIFTDEELIAEINDRLPEEERIHKVTFEKWKAGVTEDGRGSEFRWLIEKALRKQKHDLFIQFRTDEKAWQRWAWILERKFKEWRLPNKHQIGGDPDNDTAIKGLTVTLVGAKS